VRFEPMTPVFVRAKTVQALDRAATVIGSSVTIWLQFYYVETRCNVY
jgi:hypothetical protein